MKEFKTLKKATIITDYQTFSITGGTSDVIIMEDLSIV